MRFVRSAPAAMLPTLLAFSLVASATGGETCIVTSADPATYTSFTVTGRTFYVEERGVPSPYATSPPLPGSGFALGEGTTWYEESNALADLQRGGFFGAGGWWPPGCDQNPDWQATDGTLPCLFLDGEDPVNDETCGAGPDAWILVLYPGPWRPEPPPTPTE